MRAFCAFFLLAACSKTEKTEPAPHASASTASIVASAAPRASASAAPAAPAGEAQTLTGTYSLTAATLYIPAAKDWSSVKQGKDDASKLVGDGNLSLNVDGTGRVTGTIDSGPASPAVIDGAIVASEIRGVVRRKDPKDDGLTGTIVAKTDSGGTLALADATGAALRQGKVTLKKK